MPSIKLNWHHPDIVAFGQPAQQTRPTFVNKWKDEETIFHCLTGGRELGTCRKSIFPLAGIVPIRLKEHRRADNIGKEASNSAYLTWRKGTSSGEEVFFFVERFKSRASIYTASSRLGRSFSFAISFFSPLSLSSSQTGIYIQVSIPFNSVLPSLFQDPLQLCTMCVTTYAAMLCALLWRQERGRYLDWGCWPARNDDDIA